MERKSLMKLLSLFATTWAILLHPCRFQHFNRCITQILHVRDCPYVHLALITPVIPLNTCHVHTPSELQPLCRYGERASSCSIFITASSCGWYLQILRRSKEHKINKSGICSPGQLRFSSSSNVYGWVPNRPCVYSENITFPVDLPSVEERVRKSAHDDWF